MSISQMGKLSLSEIIPLPKCHGSLPHAHPPPPASRIAPDVPVHGRGTSRKTAQGPWSSSGDPVPAQRALALPRGSWIWNARMRAKCIHFFVLVSLPSSFWTSGTFVWDNPTPRSWHSVIHPGKDYLLFSIFPLHSPSKHQFLSPLGLHTNIFMHMSLAAGVHLNVGLPRWHKGKESACRRRRLKRCGFSPWVGKIPGRKKWKPTPVFLPGKFHRQRSQGKLQPMRSVKSQRWLSDWAHIHA